MFKVGDKVVLDKRQSQNRDAVEISNIRFDVVYEVVVVVPDPFEQRYYLDLIDTESGDKYYAWYSSRFILSGPEVVKDEDNSLYNPDLEHDYSKSTTEGILEECESLLHQIEKISNRLGAKHSTTFEEDADLIVRKRKFLERNRKEVHNRLKDALGRVF